jgi:mRNA interferase MazF
MPEEWHARALARTRSATVDSMLLDDAQRTGVGINDAQLIAPPRLGRALVAPYTTTIRGLPSEAMLEPGEDPIPLFIAVNLDSVESVSTSVLVERLGTLNDERMQQVGASGTVATDCG